MRYGIIVLTFFLTACTTAQLNQALNQVNQTVSQPKPLTSVEVGQGLREALIQGISKGSDLVSQLDGYNGNPTIRIPFPQDVKKVEDKLRQLGLGESVDKFVTTLNRGAEDAAQAAKPIFINAIRSMTIEDAFAILKGEQDAATNYLRKTTSDQLRTAFKPAIKASLDKVQATKYYGDIVTTYNKIPFVDKVNPDLEEYATQKAMDGLFLMIAKEEAAIRKDPVARTSEILKRVFGSVKP